MSTFAYIRIITYTILETMMSESQETTTSSQTLYEKLGGEAAVNAAVDIFIAKCLGIIALTVFSTIPTWKNKLQSKKLFDYGIWRPK
jgi:hypothetical protein